MCLYCFCYVFTCFPVHCNYRYSYSFTAITPSTQKANIRQVAQILSTRHNNPLCFLLIVTSAVSCLISSIQVYYTIFSLSFPFYGNFCTISVLPFSFALFPVIIRLSLKYITKKWRDYELKKISGYHLKYIALFSMFLDHIGVIGKAFLSKTYIFSCGLLEGSLSPVLLYIGRRLFPHKNRKIPAETIYFCTFIRNTL